jgi:hypothetical protein
LDSHTGEIVTRIPRPDGLSSGALDRDFQGELNVAARKLVVLARKGCGSELSVYDVPSGALLKAYCASGWVFSGDSTRLALSLFDTEGKTAGPGNSELIVDACTLAPVQTVAEPGASAAAPHGEIRAVDVVASGTTLALAWPHGMSLTDLRSGHTEQFLLGKGELRNFYWEAGRVAWRVGDRVSVWDAKTPARVSSFDAVGCGANTFPTLSPDAERIALGCSSFVGSWDASSHRLLARVPVSAPATDLKWLAGGRGIVAALGNDGARKVVLDLVTQKPLALAGPNQQLESIGLESRLVTISPFWGTAAKPRVTYLDAELLTHDLSLPGCRLASYDIVDAKPGIAALKCSDATGKQTLVFDSKTRSTRVFPRNGPDLTIASDVLVNTGREVELRALSDGALLPGSPVSPGEISSDSWWDGSTLIVTPSLTPGKGSTRKVSHLGSALTTQLEPVRDNPQCNGTDTDHDGALSWDMDPPYAFCDRRTGRQLGNLPSDVVNAVAALVGTETLDLSADLLLVGINNPRLFRRAGWHAVPLEDPPRNAKIVSPHLIAGSDASSQIGVWSADTGKRLARWPAAKTPGQDPRSGYDADIAPVAADGELGILVFGALRDNLVMPSVYDLKSGNLLESLPVFATRSVRFIAPGVLSVVEPNQVSFWRVPGAKRLGIWLSHPRTGEAAFLAESGEFEVSGDVNAWRDVLRCERGDVESPFESCVAALLKPGIAGRTLGFEMSRPPPP